MCAATMSVKALEWTLGLRNHASGKFLTQEGFGLVMNAKGTSLPLCLLPGLVSGLPRMGNELPV